MREQHVPDRFADVFRQRYPELVRLAGRITGDRNEAEDVAQETLGKLSGHDVLDRSDEEVAAWLRRVCMNASFNRLRSRQRSDDRERRSAAADRPLREPDTTGPQLAQVVRAEERAAVRAALARLPERQRMCVLLRHSGYRYAEIAATLGVAEGSVGVLLARGERTFRTYYEQGIADGAD
jgi:RNA polymerase sigma-70 factor (ECF subfamily)